MKDFTVEDYIKLFPEKTKDIRTDLSHYLKDMILTLIIANNNIVRIKLNDPFGSIGLRDLITTHEKEILKNEYGFEEIEFGKGFSVMVPFSKKFTKEKFFKSIKFKCELYRNSIYSIYFSFKVKNGPASSTNYINFYQINPTDTDYTMLGDRYWTNNDSELFIFRIKDITEEHLIQVLDDTIKATNEKMSKHIKLIDSSEPVFLIFNANNNSFKWIGYNDKEKGIRRYTTYGSVEDRIKIIRKAMNLFNDEEGTLQIKYGWQYCPELYVFKKEILFTSTKFERCADGKIMINISNSLPSIVLSDSDLEKIEEFGLKYFEDPDDYYAWALQAQLAE